MLTGRDNVVGMHPRRAVVMAILIAVAGSPAHAEDVVGYSGVGVGYSSNTLQTAQTKLEFTNTTYLAFDGYLIGGPFYLKASHQVGGFTDTSSKVTRTDKNTGEVMVGTAGLGSGEYVSDEFLFLFPRLEFGAAFGAKALKFTVGAVLNDTAVSINDDGVYFAIDTGLAFGVALVVGSVAAIHATLRVNASFYNAQRHFFDGGGGGGEILATVKVHKKVALFVRAGIDGHSLGGRGWLGAPAPEEDTLKTTSVYVRFGVGYVPVAN